MTELTTPHNRLTYDVVIATCNRPDALALSIPLILGQSRLPQKLIVIDSSDNPEPVRSAVAQATTRWDGEVVVEHTSKGLPRQRNLGLTYVTADVVIFPDDDSLFHPGVSEAIMDTYEADTKNDVAGVCAAEAMVPPEGILDVSAYKMTGDHRREAATRHWRNRLERRFTQLKPTLYLGQLFLNRHRQPDWMLPSYYKPVEYMTGFRMSFRTAVIKAVQFDETLIDYAVDEDIDASFSAAQYGLIVGALRAKIYHHRFPSGRGNAYTLGVFTTLNRIYVINKHIAKGHLTPNEAKAAHSRLHVFIRLKILASLIRVRSTWGSEYFKGVWHAAREGRNLARLPPESLTQGYRAAQERLGSEPVTRT